MPKKNAKKFWSFKAKTETEGELLLYGPISSYSWWGDEVTPKQFKADLDALGDISTLNVYINSDGGDVFAGQAIYSMLKRHKATKNVYIDGLAASIASLIAMAGDKVIMPANAMMMIHNPITGVWGNANEFRKMAEDLDKIRDAMLTTYETKTGMEQAEIISLLDAETWMTAEEAVENGFADEIEETKQIAASLNGAHLIVNGQEFDLSRFKNLPKVAALTPGGNPPGGMSPTKNEGRTLSAANEQHIRDAKGLLDEVLDQLGDTDNKARAKAGPRREGVRNMEPIEGCVCSCCNHGDNCQSTGAKCCICSNCTMAGQCSKPGASGCKCADCTMAQTNCCQPGAESCLCDSCANQDCMKGHEEGEGSKAGHKDQIDQYRAQIERNKNRASRP